MAFGAPSDVIGATDWVELAFGIVFGAFTAVQSEIYTSTCFSSVWSQISNAISVVPHIPPTHWTDYVNYVTTALIFGLNLIDNIFYCRPSGGYIKVYDTHEELLDWQWNYLADIITIGSAAYTAIGYWQTEDFFFFGSKGTQSLTELGFLIYKFTLP